MPCTLPGQAARCELRACSGRAAPFQTSVNAIYFDQWGWRGRRVSSYTRPPREVRQEDEAKSRSELDSPVSSLSVISAFSDEGDEPPIVVEANANASDVEDVEDMPMGEDDENSDAVVIGVDVEECKTALYAETDVPQCIWETLGGEAETVPRMGALCDAAVRTCSRQGEAVVATSAELLGFDSPLLSWDCAYLQRHLPTDQQFEVAHGVRRVAGAVATFREAAAAIARGLAEDITRVEIWLIWRGRDVDHGELGPIGDHLGKDLRTVNFWMFKKWQMEDDHPLVQSCRLHVGGRGAAIPCEYNLQPRLLVQLVGRSKVAIFPPESWASLYPAPSHSARDRLSLVGNDGTSDAARFPNARSAQPSVAELAPGDAVQVPAFWWVQVQAVSASSSVLEVVFFPAGTKTPDVAYGVSPRCDELRLVRDVEGQVARDLGPYATSEEGAVLAYARRLRRQLDCLANWDGADALEALRTTPKKVLEALDAELREVVGARLVAKDPDIDAEKWLRRMIEGRF